MGKILPPAASWSAHLPDGLHLLTFTLALSVSLSTQFHTGYCLVEPGSFATLNTSQTELTQAEERAGLRRGLDICGT